MVARRDDRIALYAGEVQALRAALVDIVMGRYTADGAVQVAREALR